MCCCKGKCSCKTCFCGGLIIWVVIFIVASILVAFKMQSTTAGQVVIVLSGAIASYILGKKMEVSSKMEVLKYSFCWLVVIAILDYIISTKFTGGMAFFASPWVWAEYALIFLAPLLSAKQAAKQA